MEQVFEIASIVTVPNAISVAKPNATPPWFLSGFIVVFIHVFLRVCWAWVLALNIDG